jgi:uncharacterized membrane protein YgcG
MRKGWTTALTLSACALIAGVGASAAAATAPVQLGAGYILDDAGVMDSSGAAEAQERLEQLYADTGVDLYAVFVDEFTDPADSESWANTVAEQNGLGPSQYLLAVAVDSRQYYLSADSAGPLAEDQVVRIEADIRPDLSAEDYSGAVIAAADSMSAALGDDAGSPGASPGGGSGFGTVLILAVVLGGIALVAWLFIRRRRAKAAPAPGGPGQAPVEQVPTEELRRRAASALVETDDALKTSEQELGFARAQFGDEATAAFVEALAAARTDLDEAFSLQQKLDDGEPDTEEQVRAWNSRIVELCDRANTRLDERAAEFDELRKLEQNAPEALARVQEARQRAAATVEPARERLAGLTEQYAPEALVTVADNPDQAADRLEFAAAELAEAQQALGGGDGGEAAVSIRAAEDAVAQAEQLSAAVDTLAVDLALAEKNATALIAELEQDVAAANALPDADGRLAAAVTAARQQIDTARGQLTGAKRPLAALQGLEAVDDQIDALIRAVRDEQSQAERARQLLAQVMTQAHAQVRAAEDFITARRGAVGAEARTRLAEAGASLVRARQLEASDPQQALAQAQRAEQLAAQAIQSAQNDVGAFGGMGGGGMSGGGSGGMLGAVLGGIVLNSVLGGGRSSGGIGGLGGLAGGMGGFGSTGGGRSRGRISPGSFGGGGTRGRRGGGRF